MLGQFAATIERLTMLKIGVFSDVHANLPALEAVLAFFEQEACDTLYHLGDAIAIGPHPAECIERLAQIPNLRCIVGNHDLWYSQGIPSVLPEWVNAGEVKHHEWTHQQIGFERKQFVRSWQFVRQEELEGLKLAFMHYGLTANGHDFKPIIRNPLGGNLDVIFADYLDADLILYGHTHIVSHMQGQTRYINPGSVGCTLTPVAPCLTIRLTDGVFEAQQHYIPYDDTAVLRAFDERDVPERDFLRERFYGGRFPHS